MEKCVLLTKSSLLIIVDEVLDDWNAINKCILVVKNNKCYIYVSVKKVIDTN